MFIVSRLRLLANKVMIYSEMENSIDEANNLIHFKVDGIAEGGRVNVIFWHPVGHSMSPRLLVPNRGQPRKVAVVWLSWV